MMRMMMMIATKFCLICGAIRSEKQQDTYKLNGRQNDQY